MKIEERKILLKTARISICLIEKRRLGSGPRESSGGLGYRASQEVSDMRVSNQKGQSLTEYAILLSVVAVASIAVTALFGATLKSKIASLGAAISGKSAAEVSSFEKQSQGQADDAGKAAREVDGMQVSEREVSPGAKRGGK